LKGDVRDTISSDKFKDIVEGRPFNTEDKELIRAYLSVHLPGQVTPGTAKKRTPSKAKATPPSAGGAASAAGDPVVDGGDDEEEEEA
jgi:hypothetical protein